VGRPRRIDPDDLLSAPEVAERMGLSSADALSVYQGRYEDFPAPMVDKGRYLKMWLRQDVDAFLKRHPRIGRKARDASTDPS
jgi:predicted DNA-binding transcriptional regulator AlpA